MKRKVIQIADSTLLVSLPKKWATLNNISKGDEIDVEPKDDQLIIQVNSRPPFERTEIKVVDYGLMAERVIHALYKKGIDEIDIIFEKPTDFKIVQKALNNETVGYEIVEHATKHCVVRNISGQIEGFDAILRRVFLLLVTMATEGSIALKAHDMVQLKSLKHLELTNNRLTTLCRRMVNKFGRVKYKKIGPLYYIIEDLENLADQYKYLFTALDEAGLELNKNCISLYDKVTEMLRTFYQLFYKFDAKKVALVGEQRKEIVDECYSIFGKLENKAEIVFAHHLLVIAQKIFNFTGPLIVLSVND